MTMITLALMMNLAGTVSIMTALVQLSTLNKHRTQMQSPEHVAAMQARPVMTVFEKQSIH